MTAHFDEYMAYEAAQRWRRIMDQSDIDYRTYELSKVIANDDLRLKITSDHGETRWLSITKTDLSAVIIALVGTDAYATGDE